MDDLANSLSEELNQMFFFLNVANHPESKNESESLSLCCAIVVAVVMVCLPRSPERHTSGTAQRPFDVVTIIYSWLYSRFVKHAERDMSLSYIPHCVQE